jgi:Protein of unknown function (DUF3301)
MVGASSPSEPSNLSHVALEITAVLICIAVGWFWMDSLKAREAALRAAREACAQDDLLFLDQTVSITAIKLVRDENGRIQLQRSYEFEYSDTGDNRRKGSIVLLGRRVLLFNVGLRLVRAPPERDSGL